MQSSLEGKYNSYQTMPSFLESHRENFQGLKMKMGGPESVLKIQLMMTLLKLLLQIVRR